MQERTLSEQFLARFPACYIFETMNTASASNNDDNNCTEGADDTEVRWIESESQITSGNNFDNDDDGIPECFDLFADPDPKQVFSFRWTVRNDDNDSENDDVTASTSDDTTMIEIELSGYKAELGQTLHSTGLTLWRASELLCDFMVVERKRYIKNQDILEVR